MRNLFFDTYHNDLVGGGGLAIRNLAVALQDLYEVWIPEPWNDGMKDYEFLKDSRPFRIGRPDKIDVMVSSKYNDFVPPVEGAVNIAYCLYPRHRWDMSGYDKILTISEYSRRAVKERWGRDSQIVIGGAFFPDYKVTLKMNTFLSVARFFMEGDVQKMEGHSKNQHIIILAFRRLPKSLPCSLILAGSVILPSDREYLNACKSLAENDPRISFCEMPHRRSLAELYGTSKVFVHAMGYRRTDPSETEHYGIVVEKALLSGCYTLVHNSGGAPEMAYQTWESIDDLSNYMFELSSLNSHDKIASANSWRTWDVFLKNVAEVFSF